MTRRQWADFALVAAAGVAAALILGPVLLELWW